MTVELRPCLVIGYEISPALFADPLRLGTGCNATSLVAPPFKADNIYRGMCLEQRNILGDFLLVTLVLIINAADVP